MPPNPPSGFQKHDRSSPLTEPWEPIFSKINADRTVLGLFLARAHTNSRGFAHGGLIAALADNTMGLNCLTKLETGISLVTVNLSLSYQGVARVGQWITFEPSHIKAGKTLFFAELSVLAGGTICARASGTFALSKQ